MLKRIIFPQKGQVVLEDFSLPPMGAGDIRVRTLYSLMSIGTENIILQQKYAPDTHFAKMFSFPQLKTGVQAVAEVQAVGEDVSDFQPGDHIYMRKAHGSHQVVPAANCSLIPEGVDLKSACWAGLAKTAFRAAWAGRFELGQQLLIIGAGPVGQMAVRWAAVSGVEMIAVVDLCEERLKHAENGGATRLFKGQVSQMLEEIRALNGGNGPSLVVDVTGNAEVFKQALAATGRFGKVILLGDSGYPAEQCLSSDVMVKGLTIQATHDSHDRDGWTQRRVDELFFNLVRRNQFSLSSLITHEFLPIDCEQAYDLANRHRDQTMGILFDWHQANYV